MPGPAGVPGRTVTGPDTITTRRAGITIKGDGLCAKCGLKDKDAKKCQNAVVVTKDGKKTTYYLAGKLSDDAHKSLGFCNASKDEPVKVEVTGTCEKKGDKLVLTPTEKIKKID